MKIGKILLASAIGASATLCWSMPARAADCDRVAATESVPQYYPQGFFSEANPLNPLSLFPQDQLQCEAAVRGVERKVQREVDTAAVQQRASGTGVRPNVRAAYAERWSGSSALSHGDRNQALAHFQRAEQQLKSAS